MCSQINKAKRVLVATTNIDLSENCSQEEQKPRSARDIVRKEQLKKIVYKEYVIKKSKERTGTGGKDSKRKKILREKAIITRTDGLTTIDIQNKMHSLRRIL